MDSTPTSERRVLSLRMPRPFARLSRSSAKPYYSKPSMPVQANVVLFVVAAFASAATDPTPPQALLDTHYVVPIGSTRTVNSGGDLQAAIDAAQPGDEIVLQAGARFVGNYILRAKTGSNWITIRSSQLSTLPEGVRVSPSQVSAMAPNSSRSDARAIYT